MVNIIDIIDNLWFVLFKKYIFKHQKFENEQEIIKSENDDEYEEIWLLKKL
jgi:hypothetical protein